ncbi:hypothetical protein BGZ63DRAFT_399541 [Mariannaea sp. PMI_226]|nr:hypothetical protein BGZ63DRAFT_399541 [Mariannaea sp. PMI_226]
MIDPPPFEVLLRPSHQAIAHDASTSPPISISKTSKLISIFLRNQANLAKFLARLHRAIHSRGGLDITLLFVAETTRLLGALLELLSKAERLKSARIVVSLAAKLPKSTLKLRALSHYSSGASRRFASAASETSTRLQTLVIILEEWQILSRLWGLLDIWMSARETSEEEEDNSPSCKLDTAFTSMYRLSLASFHICEAIAWLSSKEVLGWSPEAQDKLFKFAAGSWGALTYVEAIRLLVDWHRKRQSGELSEDSEWREQWKKDFLQNLAWAPLAVHWSRLADGGWLPEIFVALFGFYPALGYMKDVWQDAA